MAARPGRRVAAADDDRHLPRRRPLHGYPDIGYILLQSPRRQPLPTAVSARKQRKRGKGKRRSAPAVLRIAVARGEGGRTLAAVLASRLGLPSHEIQRLLS